MRYKELPESTMIEDRRFDLTPKSDSELISKYSMTNIRDTMAKAKKAQREATDLKEGNRR